MAVEKKPKVLLRELRLSEFPQYLNVFRQGAIGHATPPKNVAEMVRAHSEFGSRFFLIINNREIEGIRGGEIVGACGLSVQGKIGFLFNQYVMPQFRGFGFGAAAVEEREKIARNSGAKFVTANIYWRAYLRKIRRSVKRGYLPALIFPPKINKKRHIVVKKRL
ncbi:MAG: GNAT family N-acetyltransferase [Candidatus Diapherotrites archaeon]|nr:GNAT family N-acetyltransferase [Candidatus Diapherotrites archaeon]